MLRVGLLLLISLSAGAQADTVYINDILYVPLRGGQSQEHRIVHRGLKSGTRLERLDSNEESGYTHVRMENGTEGWVPSQYISDEPIAAVQLAELKDQLEPSEMEHQQRLLELRKLRETNTSLTETNRQLAAELAELKALSADVVAINNENLQLKSDIQDTRAQMNDIIGEHTALQSSTDRQWFLAGSGTMLIGLLFGFWVGRKIYHRRNTGGWA